MSPNVSQMSTTSRIRSKQKQSLQGREDTLLSKWLGSHMQLCWMCVVEKDYNYIDIWWTSIMCHFSVISVKMLKCSVGLTWQKCSIGLRWQNGEKLLQTLTPPRNLQRSKSLSYHNVCSCVRKLLCMLLFTILVLLTYGFPCKLSPNVKGTGEACNSLQLSHLCMALIMSKVFQVRTVFWKKGAKLS